MPSRCADEDPPRRIRRGGACPAPACPGANIQEISAQRPPMNPQLPTRQAILDSRTYEPPGEGRANKLRLDFNENTAGCSPAVPRALGKLSTKTLAMYPEYERGAKRLARHYGVKLEELMLTNGGDDALRVFLDAFVNAGERIVICEPTFPMYRYWAEVAGAKVDVLRYGADMEFPLQDALQAVRARPQ